MSGTCQRHFNVEWSSNQRGRCPTGRSYGKWQASLASFVPIFRSVASRLPSEKRRHHPLYIEVYSLATFKATLVYFCVVQRLRLLWLEAGTQRLRLQVRS